MVGETREMIAKRLKKPVDEVDPDEASAIVITGDQLDGLSDKQWDDIFEKEEIIFARTSPKNKLEIVRRAQRYVIRAHSSSLSFMSI
jgi:sodium/potassium-transporting ATPase subunit alpha